VTSTESRSKKRGVDGVESGELSDVRNEKCCNERLLGEVAYDIVGDFQVFFSFHAHLRLQSLSELWCSILSRSLELGSSDIEREYDSPADPFEMVMRAPIASLEKA
jgi:hypothetical protein